VFSGKTRDTSFQNPAASAAEMSASVATTSSGVRGRVSKVAMRSAIPSL